MKVRQSKGNNSSITDATLMKLHVHNHTMVIYVQYKFHEITSIGYLAMPEDGKLDRWKFRQSNSNNSSKNGDILMKICVHHCTVVMYILYKFDEIPSVDYLVMAEDMSRTE